MPSSTKPKSVAIITHFHASQNYGGVLQAYALQIIVADIGYTAEQLRYNTTSQDTEHASLPSRILKKCSNTSSLLQAVCVAANLYLGYPLRIAGRRLFINSRRELRAKNFAAFNAQYIPSSKEYISSTIKEAAEHYDIFITGSDQVWNPAWFHTPYYLDFVPDSKPKIAYAASTAVSSLTEEQYAKMQPLISRINHISVREKNAVDLLQGMTDKKIEWVVDPTLLLTADEWNIIAKEPPIKKPFIVAYLLGDNKANRRCAAGFAKEKGMILVTFPFVGTQRLWQLHYGDYQCYGGPDVFISLIRDAEYVITDSFHAVVFSTLFKKRFVVLKRNADTEVGAMNERLYSLFQITGMERQLVSADLDELKERIENVCYDGVDEHIAIWREKSLAWLTNALENEL